MKTTLAVLLVAAGTSGGCDPSPAGSSFNSRDALLFSLPYGFTLQGFGIPIAVSADGRSAACIASANPDEARVFHDGRMGKAYGAT